MDNGYTDQESVFGGAESDLVFSGLFGKFASDHENYYKPPDKERGGEIRRISEVLNLEVREDSLLTVQVEKYKDVPSAASFPVDEVQVPGFHCHLARKRILSLSSPQLCDERQSDIAWQSWYGRLWKWGREFRRRR